MFNMPPGTSAMSHVDTSVLLHLPLLPINSLLSSWTEYAFGYVQHVTRYKWAEEHGAALFQLEHR